MYNPDKTPVRKLKLKTVPEQPGKLTVQGRYLNKITKV